ncbi:sigma-54-dependent Fis family transcriptional regulator [Pseudomonas sp. C2B4]|uniref:sigma-54 interaction domain-containing protein n=1 Tax=Pseudomonas sp. C2B4 TaxID=2735270 RepID=UPI001586EF22|nr:sigma 54-interacting transcriptional regulator [Pseudomonas sp. C2B4]NUU38162.1 sigma 54-interacting transcriptional regulator [Pseudomonas sp. C2B4]
MFTQVPQPLAYAESLLAQFVGLSRAADGAALLGDFVCGLAGLSGCELTQLYLLDATHTCLEMKAECLEGVLQPREAASLPADYNGEQLLQFALCQNRVVCLSELNGSLHEINFLPSQAKPWQSLLCVPLVNQHNAVEGLLVCASHRHIDLQGFARSFDPLGTFFLGQLKLLQRLHRPGRDTQATSINAPSTTGYGLIGKSRAMREVHSLISKVLHSPYTVLLRGETGTGKEVVAQAIHDCGPRRSKAFVVQNCAAFPENLLESELFGYRKGAFTGADRDRPGLFDAADGGTLLLDEIGDMPLSLQAKLLRVLQEGEIRPLGSNDTHKIDVRIIAATHRDLSVLVSEGKFREDLYYRLAQFPIVLPALRHREVDILDLARHFAAKACAFLQRDGVSWSNAVLDHLASYSFPGNVRELKGLVERAVLLCEDGVLQVEHFSLLNSVITEDSHLSLRERLDQVERSLLLDCLRKNDGNQTFAARELGLPRRTFLYRLGRLNINVGGADGQA